MAAFQRQPGARLEPAARRALMSTPAGRLHTEHMVLMSWTEAEGWHGGRLVPYAPLALEPASAVVYYGQTVFEGMKAYRQADGGVAIFRPWDHARRFRRSASRLALPELPEELLIEALEALVREDRDWIPEGDGQSLYLRPIIFGSHLAVGFHPAVEATFVLTARPTGPYFPEGLRPLRVWVCEDYARAAPGGTGAVKFGGNYAAGQVAELRAAELGCDEVLFLDAVERRWVEELGGMNVFVVLESAGRGRLLTPALTGTILAGNTRNALLTLAADLDLDVEEGRLSIDDWQSGQGAGRITEAFACGTAAVVTPIGELRRGDRTWSVGDGTAGPVTLRLRRDLTDIQYGRRPDPHGWMHRVDPAPPPTA